MSPTTAGLLDFTIVVTWTVAWVDGATSTSRLPVSLPSFARTRTMQPLIADDGDHDADRCHHDGQGGGPASRRAEQGTTPVAGRWR